VSGWEKIPSEASFKQKKFYERRTLFLFRCLSFSLKYCLIFLASDQGDRSCVDSAECCSVLSVPLLQIFFPPNQTFIFPPKKEETMEQCAACTSD
jgi:hypothetical protein